MAIDEQLREMASSRNFAMLTTLMPDGQPQAHVMWVGADDDHVLMNTEVHRRKFRNVENDPRVTVTIWDAENPYRYVEVRGRVIETVMGPAARRHIDELAQRYLGRDYDEQQIASERVILRIAPERVRHSGR